MPSKTPATRQQVRALLSVDVPEKLVDELLDHLLVLKTAFSATDWERCLLRGGKLAETVMKIIHCRRTGNVVSSIRVEAEIQEAEKADLPDELRLLIPRHVRPLYDHRTKRGGAHGSFEPNKLDASVVVPIADWLVGELIRIFGKSDPETALKLVNSLTDRQAPYVEEIDGDVLVLKPGASCREELRLVLYKRYPQRTPKRLLYEWVKNHERKNIDVTLTRMAKGRETHTNTDGVILTSLGLREAETLISQTLP